MVADIITWQILDRIRLPKEPSELTCHAMPTKTDWNISFIQQPINDPDTQRLIFVHGTPDNATAFKDYLLNPIEGFDTLSIDRPGFGHTAPPIPALTLEEQAQLIEPFPEERGGEWPILFGHSMGAPIIAQVAAMYPDRVGGLVIAAGALDPELEEWKWYNQLLDIKLTSYMVPRSIRNSNGELKPLKGELAKLKSLLANITCPVIVLHAPDDMLVPFKNVTYMKENFPTGTIQKIVELDGRNHFLPWNSEKEIREAIQPLN
jgi:pimeloyl-ACP methyl ester carboxylesterase